MFRLVSLTKNHLRVFFYDFIIVADVISIFIGFLHFTPPPPQTYEFLLSDWRSIFLIMVVGVVGGWGKGWGVGWSSMGIHGQK